MPLIKYVEHGGTEHEVEVAEGLSLMEGAINKMVPGIEGDCGGLCACATCHCYIPEEWQDKCATADELETSILDFGFEVKDNSRLACQIKVEAAHDGMTVLLPERQY